MWLNITRPSSVRCIPSNRNKSLVPLLNTWYCLIVFDTRFALCILTMWILSERNKKSFVPRCNICYVVNGCECRHLPRRLEKTREERAENTIPRNRSATTELHLVLTHRVDYAFARNPFSHLTCIGSKKKERQRSEKQQTRQYRNPTQNVHNWHISRGKVC